MQKHFRQSSIIILAKYFEYIEIITYLCPMIINAETIFCIYISEVKLKGEFPWPFYTIKAPPFFIIFFFSYSFLLRDGLHRPIHSDGSMSDNCAW